MRSRLAVCHGAAVLAGTGAAMLGPLLPVLSRAWMLTDAEAGMLPAWEFAGGFCGAMASGRVSARRPLTVVLAAGLALLALGLGGASLMSRTWMPFCLFVCGLGLGFINPAANLIVAESESPAAALNLFGFSWAAGALAAPSIIALALRWEPVGAVFGELAVCAIAAAVFAAASGQNERAAAVSARNAPRMTGFVAATAAALFLYVGVETSMSVWLPTCAIRWAGATTEMGAAAQSGFWLALLVGRLLAPVWLRYAAASTVVISGIVWASAGIAMLLASSGYGILLAGAIAAGFGLAPVNPTILAIFTTRMGAGAAKWTGPVFASSGLGGAAIPWMVGTISSSFGGLRGGLAVPLLATAGMFCLEWGVLSGRKDPAA